jgi:hypothetical protein
MLLRTQIPGIADVRVKLPPVFHELLPAFERILDEEGWRPLHCNKRKYTAGDFPFPTSLNYGTLPCQCRKRGATVRRMRTLRTKETSRQTRKPMAHCVFNGMKARHTRCEACFKSDEIEIGEIRCLGIGLNGILMEHSYRRVTLQMIITISICIHYIFASHPPVLEMA